MNWPFFLRTAERGALAAVCLLGLTTMTATAATSDANPATLSVALLPDENAAKVIQENEAMKAYLEARTGKPIKLHVLTSYAAMIEAVRNGQVHLAFFGPLSYCLAKDKCAIEPFAAKVRNGSTTYTSVVITQTGGGINSLGDIRGKRMAYGDQASTSSHLIPKGMLAKAGLLAGRDYQESFLGKHDVVALNVMRGNVEAGGLSKTIFDTLIEKGTIDKTKVKVLAESAPIPEYPWVMQSSLAPELKDRIRKAFFELTDPKVLGPLKADSFAAIADSDYNVIRDSAKLLGLDLGKLEK